MEGPLDPQHPGQDAGASQPEAQDSDLHALLERLLGQGDVRPSAPGAGDDLWPDVFAAASAADEVSTIVPAPDAPAVVAELPTAVEEKVAEAGVEARRRPASGNRSSSTPRRRPPTSTTSTRPSWPASPSSSSRSPSPSRSPSRARARPVPYSRPSTPEPPAAVDAEPPSLDALLEAALPMEGARGRPADRGPRRRADARRRHGVRSNRPRPSSTSRPPRRSR